MKHLNKLSCVMLGAFVLLSCNKKEAETVTTEPAPVFNPHSFAKEKDGLCVKYGYTLKDGGNGNWSCPAGDGCAKITKCEAVKDYGGGGPNNNKVQESHYNQFIDALYTHDLEHYFSTNKWHKLFPAIQNDPQLLGALQSGQVTFVEKTNSANEKMYLAVPATLAGPGAAFTEQQVLYAMSVPAGTF